MTIGQPDTQPVSNMDKENYNNYRKVSPRNSIQPQPTNHFSTTNREPAKQVSGHPVSKTSFGPVVRRAESMKRIMQKNRKAENNNLSSVSNSFDGGGSEVVTEKGRSVKSIVGMFDQQPAIHEALSKLSQASQPLNEDSSLGRNESKAHPSEQMPQKLVTTATANSRTERNNTQVVHIAKFVQIDTPEKQANFSDAQTSPMQLSPTEPMVTQSGRVNVGQGRVNVAKAEMFSGGPKPKVAIMTSSTSSSYMSNDVFTPRTESMESPVFDNDLPYHRMDSSGRTHYSDSVLPSDGYDLSHNSYIPGSLNQQSSLQHPHLLNQVWAETVISVYWNSSVVGYHFSMYLIQRFKQVIFSAVSH